MEPSASGPADSPPQPDDTRIDQRGDNLGCGLALVILGGGMVAQNLGWIPKGEWMWPCGLIGLGVGYLYKAFRK